MARAANPLVQSLSEIKAELTRVRDSMHGLRETVNQQIGKAEVASVQAEGQRLLMAKDIATLRDQQDVYKRAVDAQFVDKNHEHDKIWDAIKSQQDVIESLIQYKAMLRGGMVLLGVVGPAAAALLTAWLGHIWK